MAEPKTLKLTPLMVDSHEDLAWNMLTFGRDYRLSALETRKKEKDSITPRVNGDTMLGYPEYQAANTALIFATLFAAPIRSKEGDWDILSYKNTPEAHQFYLDQLEAYDRLTGESPDMFQSVYNRSQLESILNGHSTNDTTRKDTPVGLIYSMEGAEGVREPQEVEEWFEHGVRIFGPAWGGNRYTGGTKEPGPLTRDGIELVKVIESIDAILDISHMDIQSVQGTFDHYSGKIIATHSNPQTLMKARESNRFLSDRTIVQLAERGGVVGIVPYNLFLSANWKKGDPKEDVTLDVYVSQIDYVCQLLGSADNVGIGTDFDGGFGYQSTPAELNSMADIGLIIPMLELKGYTQSEIAKIFGLNWIEYLKKNLPES
jgi:membrane dipeptidase